MVPVVHADSGHTSRLRLTSWPLSYIPTPVARHDSGRTSRLRLQRASTWELGWLGGALSGPVWSGAAPQRCPTGGNGSTCDDSGRACGIRGEALLDRARVGGQWRMLGRHYREQPAWDSRWGQTRTGQGCSEARWCFGGKVAATSQWATRRTDGFGW
jgi:hypothetical protein